MAGQIMPEFWLVFEYRPLRSASNSRKRIVIATPKNSHGRSADIGHPIATQRLEGVATFGTALAILAHLRKSNLSKNVLGVSRGRRSDGVATHLQLNALRQPGRHAKREKNAP